ncbi:hypothetical protein MHYP_G00061570 [Metynnis hypsauchen]
MCSRYVSERIAIIDMAIPTRNGSALNLRLINAYGPTSDRVAEDPSIRDNFYAELEFAINTPARWLIFICGDFNSKLGKVTEELKVCMGSYDIEPHGQVTSKTQGTPRSPDQFSTKLTIFSANKRRKPSKSQTRINVELLCINQGIQQAYQDTLEETLAGWEESDNPNEALKCLLDSMRKSALNTAGVTTGKSIRSIRQTSDPTVVDLSKQQKRLRLIINQQGSMDCLNLRKERNRILRKLSKRLREISIQNADIIAQEIASTDDCRKMFLATKRLKATKPTPPITVIDSKGNIIGTDKRKVEIIREWFQEQFTDHEDEPLQPFIGNPKPLDQPITEEKVKKAISALKNGRAAGPDNINSELFKCSKDIVARPLAQIINKSFEVHKPITTLGEGIMITIPKPNKPPGPPANLRPIVLLNSIRKILSIIALHRIRDKVDRFTGPNQSGFKRGRSCADIVWAQRMLVSVVMMRKWNFYKMGIDMSKAFDTIKRKKILEVLLQAGCNEDELRLIRTLLACTRMRVHINKELSAEFETTIGSPQGDSLSPVLFTCYLAAALTTIREQSPRPNPPVSDIGMPLEMEYADDVDFLDEEKTSLSQLQSIAAANLRDNNLFMNESKTEFTHVYLAETSE